MNAKKRCFVAINLPEEIKRDIFEKVSRKIPLEQCKVVPAENLHITLAFLGSIPEVEIEKAREKMQAQQKHAAFEVELKGFGDFNSRVFWIGITRGATELEAITRNLQKILPVGDERFSAHLTVARNKNLQGKETKALTEKIAKENFSAGFTALTVDFMESVLSPSGPKYKKIFSVELSR